jgi:dipeptidase E
MPSLRGHGLGGAERREHGDDPQDREDFVGWRPPAGDDETLGSSTSRSSRTWTTRTCRRTRWPTQNGGRPESPAGYAIDDETAITVTDGAVEVISEGNWRLFAPSLEAGAR